MFGRTDGESVGATLCVVLVMLSKGDGFSFPLVMWQETGLRMNVAETRVTKGAEPRDMVFRPGCF